MQTIFSYYVGTGNVSPTMAEQVAHTQEQEAKKDPRDPFEDSEGEDEDMAKAAGRPDAANTPLNTSCDWADNMSGLPRIFEDMEEMEVETEASPAVHTLNIESKDSNPPPPPLNSPPRATVRTGYT